MKFGKYLEDHLYIAWRRNELWRKTWIYKLKQTTNKEKGLRTIRSFLERKTVSLSENVRVSL